MHASGGAVKRILIDVAIRAGREPGEVSFERLQLVEGLGLFVLNWYGVGPPALQSRPDVDSVSAGRCRGIELAVVPGPARLAAERLEDHRPKTGSRELSAKLGPAGAGVGENGIADPQHRSSSGRIRPGRPFGSHPVSGRELHTGDRFSAIGWEGAGPRPVMRRVQFHGVSRTFR